MKFVNRLVIVVLAAVCALSCEDRTTPSEGVTFYQTDLFKDVQMSGIFEDSKSFADLTPVRNPMVLNAEYLEQRDRQDFDLHAFVAENFRDNWNPGAVTTTDTSLSMYEHIENLWSVLSRPKDEAIPYDSRIPLPHPYVVPGGRFREIYYWDSYFTLEGLLVSGKDELALHMLDNFAFLIDSLGFIPNGTRSYYETRSQPPFFSLMVSATLDGDPARMKRYLPALEKEYQYWMDRAGDTDFPEDQRTVSLDSMVVNRYWDNSDQPRYESYKEDVELAMELPLEDRAVLYNNLRTGACSGWDFSSRWFSGEGLVSTITADLIPVDLNSLMYNLESTLAEIYQEMGVEGLDKFLYYKEQAERRKSFVQKVFWSDNLGYFFDYNFRRGQCMDAYTLAGVYPLYFGLATEEQAAAVRSVLMDRFLKPGGLVSTLVNSGEQWDAPNGWAPLQWMAVRGLLKYGYKEDAIEIMQRWLRLNNRVYKSTGKMMEKYNVENLDLLSGGGEYPTQDGFGWTNGVALGFRELLISMGEEVPGLAESTAYAE